MSQIILSFGASSSKKSINKSLAMYVAEQTQKKLPESQVELLDLNDFEMPIYSIDKEQESGIPDEALRFKEKIKAASAIIVSFAEHNSAYSAAYKNVYDWISRIDMNVWEKKPMLLLATSPGGRGGKGVLELAMGAYSRGNPNIVGSFSLPSYEQNFSAENGIQDPELSGQLE
jgi:NAD(P)H-dependent FMN reductase